MRIGLARDDELPALSALLAALFEAEAEFVPDPAAQRRGLEAVLADSRVGEILVAREHGVPLGMCSLLYTVSTALGGRVALLEDVVVAAAERGRGVGASLVRRAVEHAGARGCLRLTLLTDAGNAGARRLYERAGFARSGMVAYRRPI